MTGSSKSLESSLRKQRLSNVVAYIPPQCFTRTRPGGSGVARNPCYVCHVDSAPPNFNQDGNLQITLSLPEAAGENPWTNLFQPPVATAPRVSDDEVLRYVRESNYVDADRNLVLSRALDAPPDEWDIDGNGRWDGYKPDVWFAFDERGFDHAPGGALTGWRAFAYYPFPGTFFPTNGSAEYTMYLQQAGAGDELRENSEVLRRFFGGRGELRASEVRLLHDDISRLLLPSAERALDLDRAYRAIVDEQAFARGRDAVLAPSSHVYTTAPLGQPTGVRTPVAAASLQRR